MRVSEQDLKCVAFVCEVRAGEVTPIATAFSVLLQEQRNDVPSQHYRYWVTAEHVINNISGNPMLRINRKNETPYEWETNKQDWRMHSSSDVAVAMFNVSDEISNSLDVVWIDTRLFVTSGYRRPNLGDVPPTNVPLNIALGDEVFFLGLFSQHHGKERNLPILRFGSIARMPTEEKIQIEIDAAPTTREIIAYLVEARSWGGQSGSPALWTHEFTFKPKKADVRAEEKTRKRVSALLGIVSSHFDIKQKAQSKGDIFEDITTSLNTGIAVVAPAHAIEDLIMNDREFVTARKKQIARSKLR